MWIQSVRTLIKVSWDTSDLGPKCLDTSDLGMKCLGTRPKCPVLFSGNAHLEGGTFEPHYVWKWTHCASLYKLLTVGLCDAVNWRMTRPMYSILKIQHTCYAVNVFQESSPSWLISLSSQLSVAHDGRFHTWITREVMVKSRPGSLIIRDYGKSLLIDRSPTHQRSLLGRPTPNHQCAI